MDGNYFIMPKRAAFEDQLLLVPALYVQHEEFLRVMHGETVRPSTALGCFYIYLSLCCFEAPQQGVCGELERSWQVTLVPGLAKEVGKSQGPEVEWGRSSYQKKDICRIVLE